VFLLLKSEKHWNSLNKLSFVAQKCRSLLTYTAASGFGGLVVSMLAEAVKFFQVKKS
jgi:hypothetical protein